jgi:hypothetical protein
MKRVMNFANATNETLIAFYESVRRQVQADAHSNGRRRLVGVSTKQYAGTVREEMDRRRMTFTPVDWNQ